MEVVNIAIEERTEAGTKFAKQIRREGMIPCVLYGTKENVHFSVKPNDIKPLVFTPNFKLAEISTNGESHKCIVKEVQLHPVTDEVIHMDFLKLEEGRKVQLEVPVRFEGTSPGVKNGGSLIQKLRKVKLKLLPENIISFVTVDISELELGSTVRVRDIPDMDGVEFINPAGVPIASVEVPRALRSLESEEEGEEGEGTEEGAEGGEEAAGEAKE